MICGKCVIRQFFSAGRGRMPQGHLARAALRVPSCSGTTGRCINRHSESACGFFYCPATYDRVKSFFSGIFVPFIQTLLPSLGSPEQPPPEKRFLICLLYTSPSPRDGLLSR